MIQENQENQKEKIKLIEITTAKQYEEIFIPVGIEEKWQPGISDPQLNFLLGDKQHYYVAQINQKQFLTFAFVVFPKEKLVGWSYQCCAKEFRGKGMSQPIFIERFKVLKDQGFSFMAASEPQMTEKQMKKMGFNKPFGHLKQFTCLRKNMSPPPLLLKLRSPQISNDEDSIWQNLLKYDLAISGLSRWKAIEFFAKSEADKLLVYDEKNEVKGQGAIRKMVDGYRVTPVYADDHKIAWNLLFQLADTVGENDLIQIEQPETENNAVNIEVLKKIQFQQIGFYDLIAHCKLPHKFEKIYSNFSSDFGF